MDHMDLIADENNNGKMYYLSNLAKENVDLIYKAIDYCIY